MQVSDHEQSIIHAPDASPNYSAYQENELRELIQGHVNAIERLTEELDKLNATKY